MTDFLSPTTTPGCSEACETKNELINLWCQAYQDYAVLWAPPEPNENDVSSDSTPASWTSPSVWSHDVAITQGQFRHPLNVFKAFPSHVRGGKIAYLQGRNALSVPPRDLRVELTRAFAQYGHWRIPVLDLKDAQDTLRATLAGDTLGETEGMSFLLFQAIMFAGVSFVDIHHLNQAGYRNREEAQRSLLNRVKVRLAIQSLSFISPI